MADYQLPPGRRVHNYGKSPFIVDLPIQLA